MYSFIKKFLFSLKPEAAHKTALMGLQFAFLLGATRFLTKIPFQPRTVMDLTFPNLIGLAAGFDKNGDYIDALASLGFGFIEIGTVTPRPQSGNPHPRLFRLTEQQAIINRMGFNNKGIDHVVSRLEKSKYRGILGINIGKNKDTPLENALADYLISFRALWKYASYITINISSPNTPGLRDLQQSDRLAQLLAALKKEQQAIAPQKYVPLVVKISPDLSEHEVHDLAHILLAEKIDGVIATNTTISRDGVQSHPQASETGGLSGKPLQAQATSVLMQLHSILQDKLPIIASGGVMDEQSAQEKLNAGASLLQIYSGFIYHGPGLIKRLAILIHN